MIHHLIGRKRYIFVLGVLIILMMVIVIFSQMAMEIYAYSFIAAQNINHLEATDEYLTQKKQDEKVLTKAEKKKKVSTEKCGKKTSEASFILPVKNGITTSLFGDTVSRTSTHLGHDWAVPLGTKVKAAADGVVEKAYYSESYGYNVLIDHGNGIETRYAHLSKLKVETGEWVSQRQIIGLSGNTGDSTGPHLHFEAVKNGVRINPLKILKK